VKKLIEIFKSQPSTLSVVVLVLASYVFNFYASDILTKSYLESLFPVPYFEAQLSFDAEKLKGWYSFLIENNTMDKYLQTQNIDFLFMASVLLLHFFALLLVSRLFPSSSRWRSGMIVCAVVSSLAPIADALENLVSYIMLADPLQFPDFLAYIYSSFAAIKFFMFIFAYAAFPVGLIAALFIYVFGRARRHTERGQAAVR
jgi:hypothetical protein